MPDAALVAKRDAALDRQPACYRGELHLAASTFWCLVGIVGGLASMNDIGLNDLLGAAVILVASNASEWRLHKSILHHRRPLVGVLFDRHTPFHHGMFSGEFFYTRNSREWKFVLLPPIGIAGIVGILIVVSGPLLYTGRTDAAAVFVATGCLYVMSYEWLHLAYHQPPESFVGRNRAITWLRHHHATHHRPENMQKWNFNVVVPLWDWVRGTWLSEESP